MLRNAALALVVLGGAAACGGDDGVEPDREALLAAVRTVPGNPPRFAIVALREEGSDVRVVLEAPTSNPDVLRVGFPAWTPDGRRILFSAVTAEREGRVGDDGTFTYYETDVFAISPDGGHVERLTETGDASSAVPSPDGTTILYARREHQDRFPPTSGLWLRDADGGNERRLLAVEDGQLDFVGGWSPDGGRIVFTRCRWIAPRPDGTIPNTCAVYTVSPERTGLERLAERAHGGAFSPDGKRILFVSDRDENGVHATGSDEEEFANELYVMDEDGSDQTRLTETEGLDEGFAAWRPDGERIVYAREGPRRFATQLMVANSDGSCPTRIAGDADFSAGASPERPQFDEPAWRSGRSMNPPLDCS
ncbi:MAG: hypothetical protein M3229_02195 [Actinomycetota bacterium]|nr:hypothetical protein [Actinomycetota bacterium]